MTVRARPPAGAPAGAEAHAAERAHVTYVRRSNTIRKVKRAAIVGAGLLAFSGLAVGAAQADVPRPPGFMIGDQYKEPSADECMKDGHAWPIKEFTCVGPHADGSWTLTITKL
ncbi:hypothetical protein ACWV95_16280 [Streptomyces albus]